MTEDQAVATPGDPEMFAPLTTDENRILSTHLCSGWYKQATVYPVLSEPWQETAALLDDLHDAHHAAMEAMSAARSKAEPCLAGNAPAAGPEPEPEAGQ
jgi:hypothetical protein